MNPSGSKCRVTGRCATEDISPCNATVRCRFVASEGGKAEKERQPAESNQSWARNWNPGRNARQREQGEQPRRGVRGRQGRGEKKANERTRKDCGGGTGGETAKRLAGCSRRSNFQNGSSSIKQVLLLLLLHGEPG